MKHPFFWLHALLAMIGLVVCAVLLMARSGHPPGIVFLPHALVAWLISHIFLGFIQALSSQGKKRTLKQGKELSSWPVALIIIVAVCGIFFLYSLGGIVAWWLSNEAWRSHRTIYVIVQIVAFICLSGILLRRYWGLLIAGISCLFASGYFVYKIIPLIVSGHKFGFGLVLYSLFVTIGIGLFGYYLLKSVRIRSFFIN
jgi:hypothetical protein